MPYRGIVLHHSACPSINGKGYDLLITTEGDVITGSEPVDAEYLHICLEGDYEHALPPPTTEREEQWFVLRKMLYRVFPSYPSHPDLIRPHDERCPGSRFPWEQLVISDEDGYH